MNHDPLSSLRRRWTAALSLTFLIPVLAGCNGNGNLSDAYGHFEATEVLVSSEASGQLLQFSVEEGQHLDRGAVVGLVDTTQLALKRRQLAASRRAVRSKIAAVRGQIEVVEAQKSMALTEKQRVEQLLRDQAATQKQMDDIEGQIDVYDRQMASLGTQNATIASEIDALDAQIAQLDDQMQRCRIVSPIRGTVLVTYAEASELTAPGKPLFKIAELDTMYLRAYVSGAQLPDVRLGQDVEVLFDKDVETNQSTTGTITWISSQAEFTPKLIQTKEERVNLVYAVKVRVANPDGALKIGMPGELMLSAGN